MEVILREEVVSLGNIGDIVRVAPGYARNFLLPKGKAVLADKKNIKAFEHEKRGVEARARKAKEAAMTVAEKLNAATVEFKAKVGEEEKLFGSITSKDIAAALKEKDLEVDRRKIVIAEPIKKLGEHTVEVKVGQDVTASVKVIVEAE
jgi:large subunit ribosomal protein L9